MTSKWDNFWLGLLAGLILPAENEPNEDLLMLLMPMLLND